VARDFQAELVALNAGLTGGERWKVVYGLRALEESWARELLGLGEGGAIGGAVRGRVTEGVDPTVALAAAAHLAEAERWQWEIGSWSTGAGEGLASMAEVRELQMARAWLAAGLTRAGHPDEAARAARLVGEVESDPNGQGKDHAGAIKALRAHLFG
jgi:hypothetical protein